MQLCAGTVTLGAGAKIQYDSSWSTNATTVAYSFDFSNQASYVPAWSVAGNVGTHAILEGDSYYASTKKTGVCTAINSCLAGAFGYDGSGAYATNAGNGAGSCWSRSRFHR